VHDVGTLTLQQRAHGERFAREIARAKRAARERHVDRARTFKIGARQARRYRHLVPQA
jgi:hypothetical protein